MRPAEMKQTTLWSITIDGSDYHMTNLDFAYEIIKRVRGWEVCEPNSFDRSKDEQLVEFGYIVEMDWNGGPEEHGEEKFICRKVKAFESKITNEWVRCLNIDVSQPTQRIDLTGCWEDAYFNDEEDEQKCIKWAEEMVEKNLKKMGVEYVSVVASDNGYGCLAIVADIEYKTIPVYHGGYGWQTSWTLQAPIEEEGEDVVQMRNDFTEEVYNWISTYNEEEEAA